MCCSGGVCGIYGTCKLCGGGRNSSVTYGPTPPPLITLGASGLLLPLSLNSGGTCCCMHLWQTVGHLATGNGFFITSRGCQLGPNWWHGGAGMCVGRCFGATTVSIVSLPPLHARWMAGPRLGAAGPRPAATRRRPPLPTHHDARGTAKLAQTDDILAF